MTEPAYGAALDALVQKAVAALTGLSGPNVRPRWQRFAPDTPSLETTWAAMGVAGIDADYGAYDEPTDAERNTLVRYETIDARLTVYGPDGAAAARAFRDGLRIGANRAVIEDSGLYYLGDDGIMRIPERINDQWLDRHDLGVVFRRTVALTYAMPAIAISAIKLYADTGIAPVIIEVVT
jgi:hypothetical protein